MLTVDPNALSFKRFLKQSLSIYVNRLFDVIPITIGFVLLKNAENKNYIPALALSFTFNLFIFGFMNGLRGAIVLRCAFHYGAQNPQKFNASFYRFIIFDILLSFIAVFLITYIKPFLLIIGVEEQLSSETALLLQKCIIAKLLHKFVLTLKGVIVAQKLFYKLNYISVIGISSFLLSELVFMVLLEMKLDGFVIAFTIRYLAETIYTIYAIMRYIPSPYLKLPDLREIWVDFFKELLFLLNLSFANYFDFIAYEIHTIYVALLRNTPSIVAWSLSIDIQRYCFYLLISIREVLIVRANAKLGQKNIPGYKETKEQLLRYCLWITLGMAIIVAATAPLFIRLYSKDKEVLKILLFLMWIYFPIAFLTFAFLIYTSLLRIINEENIQFMISLVLLPLGNILLGYLFCFTLDWKIYGTRVGYSIITVIYTLALRYAFNKKEPAFLKKIMNERREEEKKR